MSCTMQLMDFAVLAIGMLVDIKLQCLGFAYRFPSVVALSGLLRLVLPVPSPPLPSPSLRL